MVQWFCIVVRSMSLVTKACGFAMIVAVGVVGFPRKVGLGSNPRNALHDRLGDQ